MMRICLGNREERKREVRMSWGERLRLEKMVKVGHVLVLIEVF